jgi:hypothetical protein
MTLKLKSSIIFTSLLLFSSCGDFKNPELNKLTTALSETVQRKGFMTNGQLERMVINFGDNIVAPITNKLHEDSLSFDNTLKNHCSDSETVVDNSDLKESWKRLITTYHTAVAFIDEENMGQELYQMYTWPETKAYSTDLWIANHAAKNRQIKLGKNTVKGLDVLEYLVFDDDYIITCRQGKACKKNIEAWNKKEKSLRVQDRCNYMQLLIDETKSLSKQLKERWNPETGSYIIELLRNGTYGNLNQTIKVFTDALFYFEKNVKDKRIGIPSGLNEECTKDSCPEKSEHLYANFSIQSIVASLKGMQLLLTGTNPITGKNGVGLDDYLATTNNAAIFNKLNNTINRAIINFSAYQQTTVRDLSIDINPASCRQSQETICLLYQDLKSIADIMKGEFLIALNIQAPRDVQGDND